MEESAAIVRVCGTMIHRETVTSADGKFTFIVSDTNANGMLQAASEGGATTQFGAKLGGGRVSQTTRTQLWGCELRASIPGYVSNSVSLTGKDFSTPLYIGAITLRPTNRQGGGVSVSAVNAQAPEDAKKEYEKGREAFSKKKYAEAEKHLAKAVKIYPQYAVAWDIRGRVQRMQRLDKSAETSFLAAIKADDKFVTPYLQLAGLYAANGLWENSLGATNKVIELDPLHYADAYFLSALALFNLKQFTQAESHIRRTLEIDNDRHFPRAELLLARILQAQGDAAGAAAHLRAYLKAEPSSEEAPLIRQFLAKQDEQNASANTTKAN